MGVSTTVEHVSRSGVIEALHLIEGGLSRDRAPFDGLQLVTALQTTLDVDCLLQIFMDQIMDSIAWSGYEFRNEAMDIVCADGMAGQHRCDYQLKIDDAALGVLRICRNHYFRDNEIELIEYALACLIYPLRNALTLRRVEQTALRDALTKLYNRGVFDDSLHREIELACRSDAPLSMLLVDIDYFKLVNDKYGHSAGDAVLRQIADRLADGIRDSDLLCRYGGEEFVLLLANTDTNGAMVVADRLRACIDDAPFQIGDGLMLPVTVSLGVSELSHEADTAASFFARADKALYAAKYAGRNRISLG